MSNIRKLASYPKEFKLDAVKLAESVGSISKAANELGIPTTSLYRWVKEASAGSEAFRGRGNRTSDAEELRKLRLENKRLKETNEILKKAAKFFANESQ